MKISEVITQLQTLLAQYGDLDVCIPNYEAWTSAPVEAIEYCRGEEGVVLVATWEQLDTVDQGAHDCILLR